jgi:predicted Zn-dependent protease
MFHLHSLQFRQLPLHTAPPPWQQFFAGFLFLYALFCFPGSAPAQGKPGSQVFDPLSHRAAEARDADRLDEAVALYSKALTLRPRWAEGWWSLGTIEYDQNQYAQAATAFSKLVALQPKNGTAHAMLGLCQFELGKDQPALTNLTAADKLGVLKDEQLRKVAIYHLGLLQLRAKKFSAAKETLAQLARDHVSSKELTTAMGQAALLISPQEAPQEGTEGARIVDQAGEAEVLLAAKEFKQAGQIYDSLAQEYPTYPNLHLAFGRFLLNANEIDEAVGEFQKELQRDPNSVSSLLEIAAVRYRIDSPDGLKYAERAVTLAPHQPFAHYLLGLLRLDTSDPAQAIPELEIARKAFPSEASIYFSLGNAYTRVGRKAEGAKARAEFVRLSSQAEKHSGATLYDEQASDFSQRQLRTLDKEKPHP